MKIIKQLQHLFLVFLITIITACSVDPNNGLDTNSSNVGIKPNRLPISSELVGTYSLFAGSEVNFGITEQNNTVFLTLFGQKEALQKISPTRYKLTNGDLINFDYSPEGKYDRFVTMNEGRQQLFIRNESLQQSRSKVTDQAVYTSQLMKSVKPGAYTYSRFLSPARGLVDYSVYLPPQWSRNSNRTYPLVFFLHGQLGWERSFPDSVPAQQLNQWISRGLIPPMVIVSLRTGRLKGKVEEQWSSARNEALLTSGSSNELRAYISTQFKAGLSAKTTAIHGHSRGSRGAIHYALKYPTRFSSAVANAFVSDYALQEMKQIATNNLQQIRSNGIPLRISIGDKDEFALNMGRRSSPVIHQFLNSLNIPHDYEVFPGVNHGFVNVWNTKQKNGQHNGLAELQFHARAWSRP